MEGSRERFNWDEPEEPHAAKGVEDFDVVDFDAPAASFDEHAIEDDAAKIAADEAAEDELFKHYNEALQQNQERVKAEAEQWVAEAGYEPIDQMRDVKGLLKLSPEELALPVRERRRLKADRLAQFRETMAHRTREVGALVTDLRAAVLQKPETTKEDLLALVHEKAKEVRLNARELTFFAIGVERYWRQHEAVADIRAKFPDDANLMEACFGYRPEGEVRVEQRPAALHFRTFNRNDFVKLHALVTGRRDAPREEQEKEARLSAGFATSYTKIPELHGCLMVESMSEDELRYTGPTIEKKIPMRGRGVKALWNDFSGPADVVVEGVGTWTVRRERQASTLFANNSWTLEKIGAKGPETVMELDQFGGKDWGMYSDKSGRIPKTLNADLVGDDGTKIGAYTFDTDALEVTFDRERSYELVLRKVPDTRPYNPRNITHEEQHQFDHIMELYNRTEDADILRGVAVSAAKGDDPVPGLLRSLARRHRSLKMDLRARTELLAFYRDGRSPREARNFLADPKGSYVYENYFKGRLAGVTLEVTRDFATIAKDVLPDRTVSPKDVLPYVKHVFRDEYKQMLDKWARAMEVVEEKLDAKDDREKVIGVLTTESVNTWPRLSRMLQPVEAEIEPVTQRKPAAGEAAE